MKYIEEKMVYQFNRVISLCSNEIIDSRSLFFRYGCAMEERSIDTKDRPVLPNELLSLIAFHSPDPKTFLKLLTTHRAFTVSLSEKEKVVQRFSKVYEEIENRKGRTYLSRGYKLLNGKKHGFHSVFLLEKTYIEQKYRELTQQLNQSGLFSPMSEMKSKRKEILVLVGQYNNNKKHGEWVSWWHSGWLEKRVHYDNDELHGKYEEWSNPFGRGKSFLYEGQYHKNEKHGVWKKWYDGRLLIEESFVYGKRDGLYTSWDRDGRIREKGHYMMNKRVGIWEYYNKDGTFA
jgi:antitoxin component YwqK of YwqJK toxin-antitoxin module